MGDNDRNVEIPSFTLEEVRQRYYGFVLGFVRENCPPEIDHEVIAAECFERLRRYKGRPIEHIGGFLRKIAKNLIVDAVRHLPKVSFISINDHEGRRAFEIADQRPWQPEELERLEEELKKRDLQYKIWREYLDELPEWQCRIYELRTIDQLKFSKIGEKMKMSVERVKGTFALVSAAVRRNSRKRYDNVRAVKNDR